MPSLPKAQNHVSFAEGMYLSQKESKEICHAEESVVRLVMLGAGKREKVFPIIENPPSADELPDCAKPGCLRQRGALEKIESE